MIFDSLTVFNYGLYRGEHRIQLSRNDDRRKITLFGGLNGAGKTTFLEELYRLAIYGKMAPFVQGTSQPYELILAERINRQVNPRDGASVELSFRVQEDGCQRAYRVVRSWSGRKGKAKEHLQVSVDGVYDEMLTESWTEHAERFIPARLAPLFFFDGEKIEALADPDRSTQAIRTAMEALLGLDIVAQLEADLMTIERRKIKSSESTAAPEGADEQRIKDLEARTSSRKRPNTVLAAERLASVQATSTWIKVQRELGGVQRELASPRWRVLTRTPREIEGRFEELKETLEVAGGQASRGCLWQSPSLTPVGEAEGPARGDRAHLRDSAACSH